MKTRMWSRACVQRAPLFVYRAQHHRSLLLLLLLLKPCSQSQQLAADTCAAAVSEDRSTCRPAASPQPPVSHDHVTTTTADRDMT